MKPEIIAPLQKAVKMTPVECFLLETDGPYEKLLRPDDIPKKKWGEARNTSLIIPEIAKKLLSLRALRWKKL